MPLEETEADLEIFSPRLDERCKQVGVGESELDGTCAIPSASADLDELLDCLTVVVACTRPSPIASISRRLGSGSRCLASGAAVPTSSC